MPKRAEAPAEWLGGWHGRGTLGRHGAAGLLLVLAAAGCGDDATGPRGRAATARLLKGASVPASAASVLVARGLAGTDGQETTYWALSPDQGRLRILEVAFQKVDGGFEAAEFADCEATYVRASASLSRIVDCPFLVPPGSYGEVRLAISTTFSVLIDDPASSFFTDPASPTGLSRTRPAAGAEFVSFTVPQPANPERLFRQTFLAEPLVVTDSAGSPLTIHLVVDMTHTVFVEVTEGVASFITTNPEPAVDIVPFLEKPGRVEFYSGTGTALTARLEFGGANVETESVRVFYDAGGKAIYVYSPAPWIDPFEQAGPGSAWSVSAERASTTGGFRPGGYLGLDAAGTLCWALPRDFTYGQWARLVSMPVPAAVGGGTTMSVQYTSSVPVPSSGENYASGCPAVAANLRVPLTLVAR